MARQSHLIAGDIQVVSRSLLTQPSASVHSVGVQHEPLPGSIRDEDDYAFLCLPSNAAERTKHRGFQEFEGEMVNAMAHDFLWISIASHCDYIECQKNCSSTWSELEEDVNVKPVHHR
jgi:hypothetical protein